jgi:hypothetical protein
VIQEDKKDAQAAKLRTPSSADCGTRPEDTKQTLIKSMARIGFTSLIEIK